jgi:hypothetical protein
VILSDYDDSRPKRESITEMGEKSGIQSKEEVIGDTKVDELQDKEGQRNAD